ncbi:hypothetical protein [Sphingomonas prati]|uniref:Lipoprotein n=1 Tax=Sphingomonas prati TaxID=1843237 RepID=A0A7W9BRI5_9SPHN|nr:hypothetical protein [Sphingomonas prati]MBB5728790.1 hypothetical protein [Sphingomonas prati]
MTLNRTSMLLCALLVGCAPALDRSAGVGPITPDYTVNVASPWITPEQAVMLAAASPDGIRGTFRLVVRASGRQSGNLYLNSEQDYRDPRNITLVIPAALTSQPDDRFRKPVETRLSGHALLVVGTARKTRINFLAGGRPTGKYYFQTHVVVHDMRQLTDLGPVSDDR